MTERLHRVSITMTDNYINIASSETNDNGEFYGEEVIGNFQSPENAARTIRRHKRILEAAWIADGVGFVTLFMIGLSLVGNYITNGNDDIRARMAFDVGSMLFSLYAFVVTSESVAKLGNSIKGLSEAEETAGYPYRKNFQL